MLTPQDLSPQQVQAYKDILTKKVMCISSGCGFGKCLKNGTKIIMFDGSIREVQDINVGDKLLGDDNTPRTVTGRHDGHSELFKVIPVKGEPWSCNAYHTLCTVSCTRNSFGPPHQYINIDMDEYLKCSKSTKLSLKQYTTGFDGWTDDTQYPYDPYFVGVWLGDGTTICTGITNNDIEIQEYLRGYAKKINMGLREDWSKPTAPQFHLTNGMGTPKGGNPVLNYIRENLHNKRGEKNLPDRMITVPREQRLQLLAGLLDTDGYHHNCGFEITQKHLHLSKSICKLARSLDFSVTMVTKVVNGTNYYRMNIIGDLTQIPIRVQRKKPTTRTINKDHRRTGFTVEPDGVGDWVGLTVDGNHKYLMHDFTVCHNTISMLNAFVLLLKKRPESKALVVCTPQGIEKTWTNEHNKWSHTNHLKVIPLVGTPAKRLKLLKQDGDIYAISYNSLGWLVDNNKGRNRIKFNFVYADEGDCLKGPSSKWRSNLIKAAPQATYKIISSATPKTREEDDYWGLCKYLDNGKALQCPNVGDFRAMYCRSRVHNHRQIWQVHKPMIPTLEQRIAHLFIKYEMSEQATIPIRTFTTTAELKPESMAKYKLLQDTQCVNSVVFDDNGYRNEKESLDAMQLSGKLSQLSNGFLYMDENVRITPQMLAETTNIKGLINRSKKKVALDVFDDRYVLFKRLIDKIHKVHGADQPIAIPYYHKHELVQLQRILPTGVADTEDDFQNRWNRKEIPYLFMQYSRSSKSLNLQQGGYIMAFYSPTFKWVDDFQIVRRIARQGQPNECVYAYRLYLKGTIDDVKVKKLDQRFQGHARFQKKILAKMKPV